MSDKEIEAHNARVLQELDVGDTVEFPRGRYSHWAVYIGDEKVVHITADENAGINGTFDSGNVFTICGLKCNKACVKEDYFRDVLLGSKAKINKKKDKRMRPLGKEEIKQRAMSKIGKIEYNVIWGNCEHFASWCRYGVEWSDQVMNAVAWAAVGTTSWGLLGIAVCIAKGKKLSLESDEEE